MNYFRYISILLLLVIFGSCTPSKETFQRNLLYNAERGYSCYFVVPAYIDSQKVELVVTGIHLMMMTEYQKEVFYTRLKAAINNKYVYTKVKDAEFAKYFAVNDSVYHYINNLGLKGVMDKYVVHRNQSKTIKAGISDDERNAVIKFFYLRHYFVQGDTYDKLSLLAPPHKLPKNK